MEQKQNRIAPEAATDEPASSFNPAPGDPPGFADPPLISDTLAAFLDDRLEDTLEQSFPLGCRKPRHDGWGPLEIGGFLRTLAATGVVETAARSVGRSAQSAYNLRNGRNGRAFAKMWDAILIHRTRARIASELSGRSIAGCVSVRKKDGVVVSEYHYYDNRLAMSLLTRLDRLAEQEAASEAHLRTLSEDLDDYIECVEAGGDADAFVEERRPQEPAAEDAPAAPAADEPEATPEPDTDLTAFARAAGCPDYAGPSQEIGVLDLDPRRQSSWTPDQWVRAFRSGFMAWLAARQLEEGWSDGPGAPYRFHAEQDAAFALSTVAPDAQCAGDVSDLDPHEMIDWSYEDFARASRSGLLARLPAAFWDEQAADPAQTEAEE